MYHTNNYYNSILILWPLKVHRAIEIMPKCCSIPAGRGTTHTGAVMLVHTLFKLPEAKTECMENAQCIIGATMKK